jgi:hypothetical protein
LVKRWKKRSPSLGTTAKGGVIAAITLPVVVRGSAKMPSCSRIFALS